MTNLDLQLANASKWIERRIEQEATEVLWFIKRAANEARDSISGHVAFHIKSIGQIRRWRNKQ